MKRFEYQTKNRLDRLMKLLSFSQLAKLSKESFYSTCCGFNHRNEQKTKQRFLKFTHWTNSMNIRCWKLLNENTVERRRSVQLKRPRLCRFSNRWPKFERKDRCLYTVENK